MVAPAVNAYKPGQVSLLYEGETTNDYPPNKRLKMFNNVGRVIRDQEGVPRSDSSDGLL